MASELSFVRDKMLPPSAPPVREAGAVKWLRENLFSGPFNTALTIVGIVVIYMIISASLPWWLNSVWNAGSLAECRAIVAAQAGEGADIGPARDVAAFKMAKAFDFGARFDGDAGAKEHIRADDRIAADMGVER